MRAGILENVTAAVENARVGAIVIATRGRTFIAGGDVREFGPPPVPPHLPDVVNAIEQSPKPVIAALHGQALGGGRGAMLCPTAGLGNSINALASLAIRRSPIRDHDFTFSSSHPPSVTAT